MKNLLFTPAFCLLLSLCLSVTSCQQVTPPDAFGPVPSEKQLNWHETQFYAFICITTNTFNDMEWGYGDADVNIFNPSKLDAEQWMKALKEAGMKGVVLTAKHHDGFCLWPSKYTDYCVKSCSWRDGKGDFVREVADAARKYDMKMGMYLSPWDRHDLRYGTPEYLEYYRNQLQELLTEYGPVFEIWEDGANGGDGYYGGLKEERRVDKRSYYEWDKTNFYIHGLQNDVCIFSDGGPDCRWCGNESGYIDETNWCTLNGANFAPGEGDPKLLNRGEEDGTDWIPAEVDVSIRPGWFWHESENDKVKSPQQILDIYYSSIGRGANLILNIPPNKEGLFCEEDLRALKGFSELLRKEFSHPLSGEIVKAEASQVRGGSKVYGAKQTIDNDHTTYWATDDDTRAASLTFTFRQPTLVNRAMLREHIALGQRVKSFTLEAQTASGEWQEIAKGTTIGNKRLLRFPDVYAQALRVNITDSKACPLLSDIEFYASENTQ